MKSMPTQAEMTLPFSEVRSDPDFYFATKAISEIQRELTAARRYLIAITSRWMFAYEYMQLLYDGVLQDKPLERQKQFFHAMIPTMVGLGRMLLMRLDENGTDLQKALGYTFDDVKACVEILEDIDRASQREWTPQRVAEIEDLLGCGGRS